MLGPTYPCSVVVVDADHAARRRLVEGLSAEGLGASGTAAGLAGVEQALQEPCDAMVVAVPLPDLTTRQFLGMARAVGDFPIVVLGAAPGEVAVVLDAATTAGGDATVVNNLAFSIEDNAELLQMARTAAWGDAEGKARQLAQLAGLELGSAISITESISYETPPIYYERAMVAAQDGAATPIESGTQDVIVNIQVTFRIG